MKAVQQAFAICFQGIDSAASALVALLDSTTSSHAVKVVEEGPGTFSLESDKRDLSVDSSPLQFRVLDDGRIGSMNREIERVMRGSRVQLILQPARFLFRSLELPQRASEFLDGIVRAQIDRLTPWLASEAIFGWSAPNAAGSDRISLTLAATAHDLVAPLAQAIADLGVRS